MLFLCWSAYYALSQPSCRVCWMWKVSSDGYVFCDSPRQAVSRPLLHCHRLQSIVYACAVPLGEIGPMTNTIVSDTHTSQSPPQCSACAFSRIHGIGACCHTRIQEGTFLLWGCQNGEENCQRRCVCGDGSLTQTWIRPCCYAHMYKRSYVFLPCTQ